MISLETLLHILTASQRVVARFGRKVLRRHPTYTFKLQVQLNAHVYLHTHIEPATVIFPTTLWRILQREIEVPLCLKSLRKATICCPQNSSKLVGRVLILVRTRNNAKRGALQRMDASKFSNETRNLGSWPLECQRPLFTSYSGRIWRGMTSNISAIFLIVPIPEVSPDRISSRGINETSSTLGLIGLLRLHDS